MMFRTSAGLLPLPMLAACLVVTTGCSKGPPSASTPSKQEGPASKSSAGKEKPEVVDALTLIKDFASDFANDQDRVFQKYGGKRLEIEAVVYGERDLVKATKDRPLV